MTIKEIDETSDLLFTIEDDVPIPPRTAGRKSKFAYLLETMQVGQSVLIDNRRDACTIQTLFSRHGMLVTIRKEQDGKLRIWRTV